MNLEKLIESLPEALEMIRQGGSAFSVFCHFGLSSDDEIEMNFKSSESSCYLNVKVNNKSVMKHKIE